jgi:thiamine kinase-like enzyme
MQPEAIAERLFPGRVRGLAPLGGGITNRNFKVTLDDDEVVLRIGGKDTALLGIDREVEHEASRAAADLGLGPAVVTFVEPEGYLVTRYVAGKPLRIEDVRHPDTLQRIASMLRTLHDAAAIPGRFDSFGVVEAYHATAVAHGVTPPTAYGDAKAIADRVAAARRPQSVCPCHNDLLNANFIADGKRIWIVDWEYAGMGDRFFDLANFSINHELAGEQNDQLLRAYFGQATDEHRRALLLMRFMSDFREAMWGVVQQGISELDFDFVAYADEHFARLERTARDQAFLSALEASP